MGYLKEETMRGLEEATGASRVRSTREQNLIFARRKLEEAQRLANQTVALRQEMEEKGKIPKRNE